MSADVYLAATDATSGDHYHLFEDCNRFENDPKAKPLDVLYDDLQACQDCIQRAFVRKAPCSKCSADYHELDSETLDGPTVEWPCPGRGFTDLVGRAIFREELASVGVSIEEVRAAAQTHDGDAERRSLRARLEDDDEDVQYVTDGGRAQPNAGVGRNRSCTQKIGTRWGNECPQCGHLEERDSGPGISRSAPTCPECDWPMNCVDLDFIDREAGDGE